MMNRLFKKRNGNSTCSSNDYIRRYPCHGCPEGDTGGDSDYIRGNTNKCRLWFSHSEGD